MTDRRWLYLAGLEDLPDLYLGAPDVHHSWPPPEPVARASWSIYSDEDLIADDTSTRTKFYVEVPDAEDWPAGRWWTTLGEFLASISYPEQAIINRALSLFEKSVSTAVGTFLSWPIYYDSTKGQTMRWITHTLRGTLGGTQEQFQHKMDWGVPGDDPDVSEEEAAAVAVQLATAWKSAWTNAGIGADNLFSPNVKYIESGVVQKVMTEATDASGEGGNLEESYSGQWFGWPVGQEPVGVAAAASLPFEVSVAVSLQTDHRGPSGRGRLYLPPPAVSLMGATGFLNSSKGPLGYLVATYMMNGITATPYVPIVVSQRRLILNEITSVNVGAVPDSQRRRRKDQDEQRQTVWTLAGGII